MRCEACIEIAKRYELVFWESGTERNHVHFLIQSVPTYSPTKSARTVKSLTARQVFTQAPEVKKQWWGGELWGKGYVRTTVGQPGTEKVMATYIRKPGTETSYKQLHTQPLQLEVF
jgi:putative transposase